MIHIFQKYDVFQFWELSYYPKSLQTISFETENMDHSHSKMVQNKLIGFEISEIVIWIWQMGVTKIIAKNSYVWSHWFLELPLTCGCSAESLDEYQQLFMVMTRDKSVCFAIFIIGEPVTKKTFWHCLYMPNQTIKNQIATYKLHKQGWVI